MRKKTIEEELEELEKEKEVHIKKLSKNSGHSDEHVYDFDARYETHDFEEAAKNDFVYEDDDDFEDDDEVSDMDIDKMEANLKKQFNEAEKEIQESEELLEKINNTLNSSKSNSKSKSKLGIFSLFLLFPCIILLGVTIGGILMISFLGIVPITQQLNYVEITSHVESTQLFTDDEGDHFIHIKVVYNYNEEDYNCIIKEYINSLKDMPEKGDEVVLKVNPNNPEEAILPDENFVGQIICMVFGAFMTLFGLIGLTKMIKAYFR